ncbi:unnamed protein product [Plutella xylostella]|uniref:(diamondback moth) hypothetical protein n=1 Tax=Plutella xylostella TaxID=51655 RepID=A0A8S4F2M2_PLUXY|nr:unnamed protein product [Plutella xylostella]
MLEIPANIHTLREALLVPERERRKEPGCSRRPVGSGNPEDELRLRSRGGAPATAHRAPCLVAGQSTSKTGLVSCANNISRSRVNYKKAPKERRTAAYVEARLDNLEKDWTLFYNTHRQMITEVDAKMLDASTYMKGNVYESTEEIYIEYKSELKGELSRLQRLIQTPVPSGSGKQSDNNSNIRLPKISIPTFSGKYDEWVTFRDLFDSLIRTNDSLDEVQKLHYLKGYLEGEAEQLVRHIPISRDNFEVCWKQLESRYNNKKYLANCILKRMFGQKPLQGESAGAIKELLDTTNECLHALLNLGVDIKSWDIMVIYVISLKLDPESRKLWEARTSDSSSVLSELVNFKEFLEQRFRSLEFLDGKGNAKVTQPNHIKSLHTTESSSVTCKYCSDAHKIANCKSFGKEDVEARREFVRSSKLCFNCLAPNHTVYLCRVITRCRVCHKKHHSLLHTQKCPVRLSENKVEEGVTPFDSPTVPGESNKVVSCSTNMQSQVLLATTLVQVKSSAGNNVLRSLLDQGSQASFITEAAVQRLRLQRVPHKCVVSGVGSDKKPSCASKYVVEIQIQSLHDPACIVKVKAHVLRELTSSIPDQQVKLQWWSELFQVKLADPTFATPSKIDLLLGAEVCGQIIVDGLIRGPPGTPLAQNTKLGWILFGQVTNECKDNKLCSTTSVVNNHAKISEDDFQGFGQFQSQHSQIVEEKEKVEVELEREQMCTETAVSGDVLAGCQSVEQGFEIHKQMTDLLQTVFEAFAAAVDFRIVDARGEEDDVNLVTAQTVAPIKQTSLPHVESYGVVLLYDLLIDDAEELSTPEQVAEAGLELKSNATATVIYCVGSKNTDNTNLNPFIGSKRALRVGGDVDNAYEQKEASLIAFWLAWSKSSRVQVEGHRGQESKCSIVRGAVPQSHRLVPTV